MADDAMRRAEAAEERLRLMAERLRAAGLKPVE